jgi:hypothetical protein
MKTQQDIQNDVMRKFRETNSKVGHYFPDRWLANQYMQSLTPPERDLVNPALQQLAADGFISGDEKGFKLEQPGYDNIFPPMDQNMVDKVKREIMGQYRTEKMKVGHIVTNRWVSTYMQGLNPEERKAVDPALEQLIQENKIEQKTDGIGGFTLTQDGYNYIYQ